MYEICEAPTFEELEPKVEKLIRQNGWEPLGAPGIKYKPDGDVESVFQALIYHGDG